MEFETKEYANGSFPPSIISNGPMLVIEFEGDSVINTLKRKFKVKQKDFFTYAFPAILD